MDAVNWLVHGKHGDAPECACPIVAAYVIQGNDGMPDDIRQRLLGYLHRIAGSRNADSENARLRVLVLAAARVFVPLALDAAGLTVEATKLRLLPDDTTFEDLEIAAWEAGAEAAKATGAEAAKAAWEAASAATRAASAAGAEAAWVEAAKATGAEAAKAATRAASAAWAEAAWEAGAAWATGVEAAKAATRAASAATRAATRAAEAAGATGAAWATGVEAATRAATRAASAAARAVGWTTGNWDAYFDVLDAVLNAGPQGEPWSADTVACGTARFVEAGGLLEAV